MAFSLSSYLLGVGTVVGALAFGFSGGVVLTKTAMKNSPPTETRVERVSRAEPLSAASSQVPDAAVSPPATPLPASSTPEAPADGETPRSADNREASGSTAQPLPPTTVNRSEQSAKPVGRSVRAEEPKKPEPRETAGRKIARQKRDAERRSRDLAARAEHHQPEQLESQRRVFAFERPEPRPNFFELPLFGRSPGDSLRDED
jgi:type IV secretory pathway VirB10-like protein